MGDSADNPENKDGFKSDDSGVFADPSSLPKDGSDFDGWTWKMIESAICGGAAMAPDSDGASRAKGIADPQTLYDASKKLYNAQQNLNAVAEILDDQTEALAGDHGAWKGDAAKAFSTMMQKFTGEIRARVLQIDGGTTGG